MMRLPRSLDPFQPRALQQDWEEVLGPGDLPRLVAAVARTDSVQVTVRLGLRRGSLGEVRLYGRIAGSVERICQRCLEPLVWAFDLEPEVVLQAPGTPDEDFGEDAERLELDADGRLHPLAWVEDEILLAMPLVARHEHCGLPRELHEFGTEGDGAEVDNPFAVLGSLRGKS